MLSHFKPQRNKASRAALHCRTPNVSSRSLVLGLTRGESPRSPVCLCQLSVFFFSCGFAFATRDWDAADLFVYDIYEVRDACETFEIFYSLFRSNSVWQMMTNLIFGGRLWAWFCASCSVGDPGQKRGSQKSQKVTIRSQDRGLESILSEFHEGWALFM